MRARLAARAGLALLALTLALWLGAERWVATTELPPLTSEASVNVLASDGQLLRAFTVGDGRWRRVSRPGRGSTLSHWPMVTRPVSLCARLVGRYMSSTAAAG